MELQGCVCLYQCAQQWNYTHMEVQTSKSTVSHTQQVQHTIQLLLYDMINPLMLRYAEYFHTSMLQHLRDGLDGITFDLHARARPKEAS